MPYNRFAVSIGLMVVLAVSGCGQSGSAPNSAATQTENQNAATVPAKEPAQEPIVVPAGTPIAVTVDQAVSSKTNDAGDHFAASIAAPVMVDGKQVIARGAKVSGTVTEAKSAGRFKGNAEIALTLRSVTVDGKEYDLKTSTYSEVTKGRGKRTAEGTGIGAAAGAVIGALAGGGKGAAIGAGAGAGAGVTGAALTGERDVEVPAESKINFKLSQPVTIDVPVS
jgi:hypothetical protein